MKATLRCHAHVSRFVHPDIAATITTPGLVLQVLSWPPDRKNVDQSFPPRSALDDVP